MDRIPDEVWFAIIQYLDVEDLLNLALVSKKFNCLINDEREWRHIAEDFIIQLSNRPSLNATLPSSCESKCRCDICIETQHKKFLAEVTEYDSERQGLEKIRKKINHTEVVIKLFKIIKKYQIEDKASMLSAKFKASTFFNTLVQKEKQDRSYNQKIKNSGVLLLIICVGLTIFVCPEGEGCNTEYGWIAPGLFIGMLIGLIMNCATSAPKEKRIRNELSKLRASIIDKEISPAEMSSESSHEVTCENQISHSSLLKKNFFNSQTSEKFNKNKASSPNQNLVDKFFNESMEALKGEIEPHIFKKLPKKEFSSLLNQAEVKTDGSFKVIFKEYQLAHSFLFVLLAIGFEKNIGHKLADMENSDESYFITLTAVEYKQLLNRMIPESVRVSDDLPSLMDAPRP